MGLRKDQAVWSSRSCLPQPKWQGAAPLQPHKHSPSLFDRRLIPLLLVTLFCGVEGSIYLPRKLYGEVTSPLYPKPYPNDLEVTTVITVPTGYRVKLVFWQFDVEPSEGCFYDYVKVGFGLGRRGDEAGSLHSEYTGQYACPPSLCDSVEMLASSFWCHRGGIWGLLRPSMRLMGKRKGVFIPRDFIVYWS